ncbi:hypothetical protein B0H13DRAFT_1862673 [Mycena leptocephala]|nr:hypothetical protein B0H13DRAFT_1862673 [Mycena leptocephala]
MDNTTSIPDYVSASDSPSSSSEPRTPVSVSSESPGPDRADQAGDRSTERYHPYGKRMKKGERKQKTPKSNRRMWKHALEKPLFNSLELSELGITQRRPIYIASLEAHIDRLHTQLLSLGHAFFPIAMSELDHLKGLNTKTCKVSPVILWEWKLTPPKAMVASLHNDIMQAHERLLELQRTNEKLEAAL